MEGNPFDSPFPPGPLRERALPEAFDRTRPSIKFAHAKGKRRRAIQKTLRECLDDFLAELQNERGLSQSALRFYAGDLQMYVTWLQAKEIKTLRAVTPALIEAYAHDLRAGQMHRVIALQSPRQKAARNARFYAAPTLARKLAAVREWHQFLARENKWTNPAINLQSEWVAPRTPLILSAAQTRALLNAPLRGAAHAPNAPRLARALAWRDAALLHLLCEGISAATIGALEVDVSLVQVTATERATQVCELYVQRARPILEARLAARLKQKNHALRHLFFTNRGTPLCVQSIQQVVRRHAAAAQLPEWVSAARLCKMGLLKQELNREGNDALATLPRATQLRHAYEKAHPRA